ncbi:protein of unknown function [Micropruina glycogenica]|uniref:Uncharacterized protein n=1 Tax=Micropruina glycogenica TaxID=75385 RepID=A0A2N9JAY7_9ACTN|nr:protein of unknown function [Micropruina glycogenica]
MVETSPLVELVGTSPLVELVETSPPVELVETSPPVELDETLAHERSRPARPASLVTSVDTMPAPSYIND